MSIITRRLASPLLANILLWVFFRMVVETGAESLIGTWFAERLLPFGNAHLLEAALEGNYSPLTDPIFLVHSISLAIVVFGGSNYYAGTGASRVGIYFASASALIALMLLAWIFRYVWNAGYPPRMRLSFVLFLGACATVSCVGLWLAKSRHP